MQWIKATSVYAFAAGFFYLILAYIGIFSTRQSVVMALLIVLLVWRIDTRASKPARRFSPYYLRVHANWYDLLIDFKLIGKPEDWQAIQKTFEGLPSTEYSVLRDGICFTVAHQSEDFKRTMIYSNNHRTFVSEVDFEEDMDPIRIEPTNRFGEPNKCDVRFFMRFGRDGYNLGIRVPNRWWDQVKASCENPMNEDNDYATGQVELFLATISYREFDLYWEPVEWSSTFYEKTAKRIRDRRDEERKKFAWKKVEHADIPELSIDWPESIEHKYFNTEHRAI